MTVRLATPDSSVRTLVSLVDMMRAVFQCASRFRSFRPDAVLSTGGFVSVPAMLGAWVTRTPIVIFLPDIHPGTTVRLTARMARRLAVSTDDSLRYLPNPNRASVTGYPLRDSFLTLDRVAARSSAGLSNDDLQLLVMGGSLGAAAINRALATRLPDVLSVARVVHVCGSAHIDEMTAVRDRLPEDIRDRYRLTAQLDEAEMAAAMFASDLAITRAGASILGELPAAGLPAIVVPLPAARVGQEANAIALERHNACVVLSNDEAESGALVSLALTLLGDDDRRRSMAASMATLRRPAASDDIARIVSEVASGHA